MGLIKGLFSFVSCCISGLIMAVQAHGATAIEWQPEQLDIRQIPGSTINETVTVTFSQQANTLSAVDYGDSLLNKLFILGLPNGTPS